MKKHIKITLTLLYIVFIIVNGSLFVREININSGYNIKAYATPLYADKNEGTCHIGYDYRLTYIYTYNDISYLGSDYIKKESIAEYRNNEVAILLHNNNPEKSIISKKYEYTIFYLVNISLGCFGLYMRKKSRRNSKQDGKER